MSWSSALPVPRGSRDQLQLSLRGGYTSENGGFLVHSKSIPSFYLFRSMQLFHLENFTLNGEIINKQKKLYEEHVVGTRINCEII